MPDWLRVLAAATIVFGVVVAGSAVLSHRASLEGRPASPATAPPSSAPSVPMISPTLTTPIESSPLPFVPPPTPQDFIVDVVVTAQQCWGGFTCNYNLSVYPNYIGPPPATVGRNWLVVYEIVGGDDPQINNFELVGDDVRFTQELGATGPPTAQFTARVTSVVEKY